jgi:hypothetical protein
MLMTDKPKRRGGVPKLYPESVLLLLPEGCLKEIDSQLRAGETRLGFIRAAIVAKIAERRRRNKS